MRDIDYIGTVQHLEKFQAERVTADELYHIVGGLRAGGDCSCGTVSQCHVDGNDEAGTT